METKIQEKKTFGSKSLIEGISADADNKIAETQSKKHKSKKGIRKKRMILERMKERNLPVDAFGRSGSASDIFEGENRNGFCCS